MRSSKNRNRGNKNRNRPSGGNIVNRVFDSNGPDGKVRGTPQQIIDKYTQLHRDAALAGDRVDAENFAQHAEHYTRMLAEAQREIDARRVEQEEQNRARQAERDRERAERLKAQEEASGMGDQPDLLEEEAGAGPIETPEQAASAPEPAPEAPSEEPAPKPKRRARRPRKPKEPEAASADAPSAEEGAQPETPPAKPEGDGSPVEAAE